MGLVTRKLPLIFAFSRDTHNRHRGKASGESYMFSFEIKEKKAAKSAALRKTTLGKNIPCK
jgi:hypothetical protein